MRHGLAHVTGDVTGTPHPGEVFAEVAASEELLAGPGDDGTREAVAPLIALVVYPLEFVVVPIEQLPLWRLARPARALDSESIGGVIGRSGNARPTAVGAGPLVPGWGGYRIRP